MGALCCKKKKIVRQHNQGDDDKSSSEGDEEEEREEEGKNEGQGGEGGDGGDGADGAAGGEDGENEDRGSDPGEGKKKKKKKTKDTSDVIKIEVHIKNATGLRDADWMGQSDPYCIMEIPHPSKQNKRRTAGQTHVVDDCSDPIWNHVVTCKVRIGDPLYFTIYDKDMLHDELLGRVDLDSDRYYPFGYKGELRLEDTGSSAWCHMKVEVKILEAPKEEVVVEECPKKKFLEGLDFEENNVAWKKAHAVVTTMENDEGLAKEETTSTALDTLVRLAESGLPIPHEALARVVVCLQSSDRRYRLASLMICKALGRRIKPFAAEVAEVLADNDEDVRGGACKVLGTLGNAATPHVADMGHLLNDEVPSVRSAALEALGVLSQADCLQALVVLGQCLDHDDKRYRLACCLILKAVGVKATPHAYPLADCIDKDPSIDVRIAACSTLGNIGVGAGSVQPALMALYRAENDSDPRVQNAAKEAINKLQSQGRPLPKRPDELTTDAFPKPRLSKAKPAPKAAASKAEPAAKPKPKAKAEPGLLAVPDEASQKRPSSRRSSNASAAGGDTGRRSISASPRSGAGGDKGRRSSRASNASVASRASAASASHDHREREDRGRGRGRGRGGLTPQEDQLAAEIRRSGSEAGRGRGKRKSMVSTASSRSHVSAVAETDDAL